MKWIAIAVAMSSLSAFAQSAPQDCLKIKNKLDRRYCLDKYIETVKDKNEAEKKSWSAGLSQTSKDEKTAALEQEIQAKKEWMDLMKTEVELSEKQLSELKAQPVAAAAAAPAPKKEKKKKKKGGFKIKL